MSEPEPGDASQLGVELMRQIDAVCRRFEGDWRAGARHLLDSYLAEVPDQARPALRVELEAMEFELRRSEETVARVEPGLATKAPTMAPVAPPTRPSLGLALPPIHEQATIAPGDQATIDQEPGSTGEAAEPTLLRVRYFGDYEITREIARGGMGVVFQARQLSLNRPVALKMILAGLRANETDVKRFYMEAEAAANLEHPGIVPVYGLGTYDDGRPYYAMRFVQGDSLQDAIERFHADRALKKDPGRRSLELRKLLRQFQDVCNAIEYAHSRGILHRDIKPGNVIVGRHGETLVVDWGLAKAKGKADVGSASGERPLTPSSASGGAETLPGSVLGTPAFMSPEQARGDLDALGPHSDVYSLGATLYCLLTGRAPFAGGVGEVLCRVLDGDFPPPRRLDPSVGRALEAVCRKAMALRPENRYRSCRALAEDVERWMADEPVSVVRERFWHRIARRLRRRPMEGVLAAALGLGILLALAAWREIWVANESREYNLWTNYEMNWKRSSRERKLTTDLSIWLDEVGCQFAQEGNNDQARQSFERALAIREQLVSGGPTDSYLSLLEHYASLLRSTGERVRAGALEQRAESLRRRVQYPAKAAKK